MMVRPTLRYLRADLHLPLPTARVPPDEIDHPILRKAAEQFAAPTPRMSGSSPSTTWSSSR
jgi:hypothetical protein